MNIKMPNPNAKELQRRIEILEVDLDAVNRERENLIQEMGLIIERVKRLEDRLEFHNACHNVGGPK